MTRIQWVTRGTGTPKEAKDEVNKNKGCECDG